MKKTTQTQTKAQGYKAYSAYLGERVYHYLGSYLVELDANLDRRLVETFLGLVMVLIMHRHRNHGLLLSELGGYLLPPAHAPAGTKRISNLLRSSNWDCEMIEQYLWQQADQRVTELSDPGETALTIWDESILEKSESLHLEGLCAVRSTKAVRLKRIKPGYFNPAGGRPIFVPGYNWLQVLICGLKGPRNLAHLHFWTTRGERQRKAWEITRSERSMDHRLIWDARRRCQRKIGLVFVPVFDNTFQQPLTRWCAEVVTSRSMQADLLLINSISVLESRMRLTFHVRFEWGSMEK